MRRAPLVTVHVAQSLDGRLALEGLTTELSTPEGKRAAHQARADHDAVLVGVETVRIDDPRLTVRLVEGADPLRVVLASDLELPASAKVLEPPGRVLVLGARGRASDAAHHRLVARGVDVAILDATADGLVSLEQALDALAERGVERLLVEGGARVLTSFFRARLVHRVEIEIAMRFLGAPGIMSLGAFAASSLALSPTLTNVAVERLGSSVLLRGDVTFPDVRAGGP
jgi:5-amino-6-(5-phosphoribosylamino)uracil reductase/diaminohydroxyphosphoribosylaminopyrimidine deaminase/5-amino-6-(5-phosphoribosylamino)uracil reductase